MARVKPRFGFQTKKDQRGTVATLQRVRTLLTPRENWIKGSMENDKGGFCLLGACDEVDGPFGDLATAVIGNVIDPNKASWGYASRRDSIIKYNDEPKRSHAVILEFLDRCIREAEKAPAGKDLRGERVL